jgi:soluble lytic murein transglycosylase-like protein
LRKIAPRADARLGHALLALAQSLDLPATQMRLAQFLAETRGMQLEAGLLPMPDWRPPGATPLVDRALVYAVIRAESAFDADARSPAGARGVMQLMPGTAEAVAALEGVQLFSKDDLFEPALNVQLGEAYLAHLLETGGVGGNLVKLAAAYNAGPARIAAWQDLPRAADDPLLFIEAIPIGETRRYVKNVLTNFWRYRLLLAQPVGSRDDLARGRWPHYVALDGTKIADGGH